MTTQHPERSTGEPGSADVAIFQDPRLRGVAWRDLVPVTSIEIAKELALPAAWLALSLILAHDARYVLALGASFVFFLTGLRLVHNAFHSALGLSRAATSAVPWVMSAVMLGSMHAVRFNHLRHHKHLLNEIDVEGMSAAMSGGRALLFGPVFPIMLHATALRHGDRRLRLIVIAELLATLAVVVVAFGVLRVPAITYHVGAMLAGQCLTAFFAVWTVHHHCDRTHYIARTVRHRIKNALTFNMFLHVEHHLFPRVPTCHLPALSRRIDVAAPELKQKVVF